MSGADGRAAGREGAESAEARQVRSAAPGHDEADASEGDSTIFVRRAVDSDETVAVARAGATEDEDPKLALAADGDVAADPDVTRVVARAGQGADQDLDATRAVVRPGAGVDPDPDATKVVARPALDPIRRSAPSAGTRGSTTNSRNPAPPVEEPEESHASRDLAALMFKPALDPKRRARESPFAEEAGAGPRQGVSRGIPVVYGARNELGARVGVAASPAAPSEEASPPALAADRSGLPSTARLNRRDRRITLAGGAALLVLASLGLWWIGSLALG